MMACEQGAEAMDASDLKVFEAVVRLGSMSRASQELNTVQSNVTTRIRALEEELGVELFHRTNRGVTPTPAAKRLLPYSTIVARVLADARRAAMDDGTPAGPLVVGSLETTAAMRLSPVLARYTAAYPDVDLTLRTGTSCELVDQVLARQLDGAFVCGPVEHPAMAEDVYFDEELVVLTAPGVSDLEAYLARPNLKIIVLRAGCSYRLILEGLLAKRGIVGFKVLEFGTPESIFATVSAGLGLTLFPKQLVGAVWPETRVAMHCLDDDQGMVKTVFIRRRDTYASSALGAFLDIARAEWQPAQMAAE
jgi:LysR family transcriptional regulator, cell division regulator